MKHILVLTTTYPRWKNDHEPGFVHNLNYELAKNFRITVVAPHYPGASKHEIMGGVEIHRTQYFFKNHQTLTYDGGIVPKLKENPLRVLLAPFLIVSLFITSLRIARRLGVDGIHAHWLLPQGVIGLILKRCISSHPPVLVTSHGADLFSLKAAPLRALKNWVIAHSDNFTVVSKSMKTHCERTLGTKSNIVVRSMGVDTKVKFSAITDFKDRSGIIFVGRLVEKKGVDLLLEAFSNILKAYPDQKLTIVGDGTLRAELKRLSKSLNIDKSTSFIGAVKPSAVAKLLNASKICVMPSRIDKNGDQEGLGLVAAEAISCGCICITSDLEAISDVNDCPQLKFKTNDVGSLTERLLYTLEHEDEMYQFSQNVKHSVREKFDWEVVGRDYVKLFDELFNGS